MKSKERKADEKAVRKNRLPKRYKFLVKKHKSHRKILIRLGMTAFSTLVLNKVASNFFPQDILNRPY